MRAGAGVAVVAACGTGLVGCSGGDEDVSAEPTNPSAGKLGGKLTIYTSCSESLVNAVVPAFMVEHAVAVQVVRGTTGALMDLVAAEVAAGAPVADVIWGGDASWYTSAAAGAATAGGTGAAVGAASGEDAADEGGDLVAESVAAPGEGCFETYVSGENRSVRDDCRNVGGVATPVTREVPVLVGGPALSSGDAELLHTYADLCGFAGGVALEEPSVSEATLLALAALEAAAERASAAASAGEKPEGSLSAGAGADVAADGDTPGTDAGAADAEATAAETGTGTTAAATDAVAEVDATSGLVASQEAQAEPLSPAELRALGTVVSGDELGDGEAVLRAVLDGRAPVGVALEQQAVAEVRSGNDLQVIYPVEESAGVACCTAVVRSCTNLEQAHAWIDFVTGQACQQVLVRESFARPVRDDVGAPEGLPELGEALTVDREGLLANWAEEPEAGGGSDDAENEVAADADVSADADAATSPVE